jgi:hypothetical protein
MVATAARTILENLDRIPNGDQRTKIAIIAFDVALHFFTITVGNLASFVENRTQAIYPRVTAQMRPCSLSLMWMMFTYPSRPTSL